MAGVGASSVSLDDRVHRDGGGSLHRLPDHHWLREASPRRVRPRPPPAGDIPLRPVEGAPQHVPAEEARAAPPVLARDDARPSIAPRRCAPIGSLDGLGRRHPVRLVVALSVAALPAVFLRYTSFAGGATPSLRPSRLADHPG